MARIVTGSVAESVAPTDNASTNERSIASIGINAQTYRTTARTKAEMKVPAKANVRMVPMCRKKFPCAFGR